MDYVVIDILLPVLARLAYSVVCLVITPEILSLYPHQATTGCGDRYTDCPLYHLTNNEAIGCIAINDNVSPRVDSKI